MTRPPNAAASILLDQACASIQTGAVGAAADAFKQALKADPDCVAIPATYGTALVELAKFLPDGKDRRWVARAAEEALLDALSLDWQEPKARQSLQLVAGLMADQRAPASPEVEAHFRAGTAHFAANRLVEALAAYTRVAELDPSDWTAIKYIGNCHYAARRFDEAERTFRRAIEMNPRDPQTYRFLCSTLRKQRNYDAMFEAAYGAIAADPRYWSGWLALDDFMREAGRPLARCRLKERVSCHVAQDGKPTLRFDPTVPPSEIAAWMVYATKLPPYVQTGSAFERERDALATMASHIAGATRQSRANDLPPELKLLPVIVERGDLDAAVYLLRYREEFRDEFETWKRSGTGATEGTIHRVKSFLVRSKLRPI